MVHSKAEWDAALAGNAGKTIVVDFTATWCERWMGSAVCRLLPQQSRQPGQPPDLRCREAERTAAGAPLLDRPPVQVRPLPHDRALL